MKRIPEAIASTVKNMLSVDNCTHLMCKCGVETLVPKNLHATKFTCSACIQQESLK